MTTIFGNNYNNIAGAGETPIYQLAGGAGSSVSKYSSGWLTGSAQLGGDPNISNGGVYTITHNLGTKDIHVACYVNPTAASDDGTVYSAPLDSHQADYRGFMTTSFTDNTVTIQLAENGFAVRTGNGSWVNQAAYNNSYVKFVVTG
jgi:hypothetical protein